MKLVVSLALLATSGMLFPHYATMYVPASLKMQRKCTRVTQK